MYDASLNLTQPQDVKATWLSVFSLGSVYEEYMMRAKTADGVDASLLYILLAFGGTDKSGIKTFQHFKHFKNMHSN